MAFLRMNYLSRALGIQNNVCLCLPDIDITAQKQPAWDSLTLLHDAGENGDLLIWYTNVLLHARDTGVAVILPPCVRDDWRNIPLEAQYEDYLLTELPQTCADFYPLLQGGKRMLGGFGMGAAAALRLGLREGGRYAALLCASAFGDDFMNALPPTPPPESPAIFLAPDAAAENCDAFNAAVKLRDMGYDAVLLPLPPSSGWERRDAVIRAFLAAISKK